MKTVVVVFVFFFCSLYQSNSQEFLSVSGRNLTLNGEKVFLSGMNQAWHSYGLDFGLNFYSKSRPFLIKTLDDIKKSGGNSIRIWLHTGGEHTPQFNSSGYVTGLDPNITRDMVDFVQQAQQRNILVTYTVWNCAIMDPSYPVYGLLIDDLKLQSYVEYALPQMVRALKSQRGLGMWEIINEPEGCIKPEVKDTKEPCYDTSTLHKRDFSDWTHQNISLERVLRFIALQAHVIHREDPKALVTVGSWTYKSVTNELDRRNFYSDSCLAKASGGLLGARLDLYQIHCYDTWFFYLPHDPFEVEATIYKLDKPVIIGEFSQKKGGFKTSPEQFTWAYERGYNGAWSWCALDADDASDDVATQMKGMNALKNKDDQSKGGRVNINLQNKGSFIYQFYLLASEFLSAFGSLFTLFLS